MTVADASQARLAYVAETVIGTTPATPVFQTMRYVSEGVNLTKQTAIPDEIRPDRNVPTSSMLAVRSMARSTPS